MEDLVVGRKFSTYNELNSFIKQYEKTHFAQLFIANSSKLGSKISFKIKKARHAKPDLKYYCIKYSCIMGGKYSTKGKGLRKSRSFRSNCPFEISVGLSFDGESLEITRITNEHNHILSEEIFKSLPQQRKLNDQQYAEVTNYLDMKCNKRMLQKYVQENFQTIVTLKDLRNIKYKMSRKNLKTFRSSHNRNKNKTNMDSTSIIEDRAEYENENAKIFHSNYNINNNEEELDGGNIKLEDGTEIINENFKTFHSNYNMNNNEEDMDGNIKVEDGTEIINENFKTFRSNCNINNNEEDMDDKIIVEDEIEFINENSKTFHSNRNINNNEEDIDSNIIVEDGTEIINENSKTFHLNQNINNYEEDMDGKIMVEDKTEFINENSKTFNLNCNINNNEENKESNIVVVDRSECENENSKTFHSNYNINRNEKSMHTASIDGTEFLIIPIEPSHVHASSDSLSKDVKYRKAFDVCKEISSALAQNKTASFLRLLKKFEKFRDMVKGTKSRNPNNLKSLKRIL